MRDIAGRLIRQTILTGTPIRGTTRYATRKPRASSAHNCACGVSIGIAETECACCEAYRKMGKQMREDVQAYDRHVDLMFEAAKQRYRARQKAKRIANKLTA